MNPPTSTASPKMANNFPTQNSQFKWVHPDFLRFLKRKNLGEILKSKCDLQRSHVFFLTGNGNQTPPKNLELPSSSPKSSPKKKVEKKLSQVTWIVAPAYASQKPHASCVLVLGRTHRTVMDISYHDHRRCLTALPAMCLGRFPWGIPLGIQPGFICFKPALQQEVPHRQTNGEFFRSTWKVIPNLGSNWVYLFFSCVTKMKYLGSTWRIIPGFVSCLVSNYGDSKSPPSKLAINGLKMVVTNYVLAAMILQVPCQCPNATVSPQESSF